MTYDLNMEELGDLRYDFDHLECQGCEHFDMEIDKCLKKHRPRKYYMDDGPNEYCHFNMSCLDFVQAETDFKSIRDGINMYFAV